MSRTLEGMIINTYRRHRETLGVRASIDATAKELNRPKEEVATLLGFKNYASYCAAGDDADGTYGYTYLADGRRVRVFIPNKETK